MGKLIIEVQHRHMTAYNKSYEFEYVDGSWFWSPYDPDDYNEEVEEEEIKELLHEFRLSFNKYKIIRFAKLHGFNSEGYDDYFNNTGYEVIFLDESYTDEKVKKFFEPVYDVEVVIELVKQGYLIEIRVEYPDWDIWIGRLEKIYNLSEKTEDEVSDILSNLVKEKYRQENFFMFEERMEYYIFTNNHGRFIAVGKGLKATPKFVFVSIFKEEEEEE